MQNQQQQQHQRVRRRMPPPSLLRPGSMRPRPLLLRPGIPRPPGFPRRFPFRPPLVGRGAAFGLGGRLGFGVRSDMLSAGDARPRQKILVNPHFRGTSPSTPLRQTGLPVATPSAAPKLMRMDLGRPHQQHPQYMVREVSVYRVAPE